MKKSQVLKLVGKSTYLAKSTDQDLSYRYYEWLSFVEDYTNIDYATHKAELRQLEEQYAATKIEGGLSGAQHLGGNNRRSPPWPKKMQKRTC